MQTKLFREALSSLILVSDYVEFLETGNSFIVDTLTTLGYSKTTAQALLVEVGMQEEPKASSHLKKLESLGLSDEFEIWSDQDENINECTDGILSALQIGISALNHPHRFH